jgi:PEGA domain
MDPAAATGASASQASFLDGLGERRRGTDATGAEPIERLCLHPELTKIPSFEFALRERASRLAAFRHPCFARVRSIDRLGDPSSTLAVVSDAVRGVRLSTLLTSADRPTIDINAAIHLIRQLVSAVAVLHEHAPDVGHGAIAPERLVITPNARVIVVEYVLGAALEQLRYPRDRYWSDLRVAVPPSESLSRFDHRADVTQIGVTALSLILGRTLQDLEYPTLVGDLLASATAISARGDEEPLPSGLRAWLGRALQLDPRRTFESALDARDDLEHVLSDEDDLPGGMPMSTPTAPVQATAPPAMPSPAARVAPAEAVHAPEPRFAEPPRAFEAPRHVDPPRPFEPAKIDLPPAFEAMRSVEPPRAPEPVKHAEAAKAESSRPLQPFHVGETDRDDESIGAHNSVEWSDEQESSRPAARAWMPKAAVAAAAAVVLLTGGYVAMRFLGGRSAAVATGTVSVTTVPPGAQVLIDGQARGATPLTVTVQPGAHTLELRGGSEPRTMPITVNAGQEIAQYVELGKPVDTFGKLQVRSEPAGAQVVVDGTDRGKAPVLIDALTPGEHAVVLQSDATTVKQTVTVEAGQTASLVVPLAATEGAPVSGWVAVKAPVELQLYEGSRLLGTTSSDRVMVSAGKHDLDLVNEPLGYRVTRTIQVPPGKVASIAVNWPTGTLAINALPWAEVLVDGNRVGETPIGNLTLPIGPHEILFRHPDLGEQRQAVTVSLKMPARVSVDMRKKP